MSLSLLFSSAFEVLSKPAVLSYIPHILLWNRVKVHGYCQQTKRSRYFIHDPYNPMRAQAHLKKDKNDYDVERITPYKI